MLVSAGQSAEIARLSAGPLDIDIGVGHSAKQFFGVRYGIGIAVRAQFAELLGRVLSLAHIDVESDQLGTIGAVSGLVVDRFSKQLYRLQIATVSNVNIGFCQGIASGRIVDIVVVATLPVTAASAGIENLVDIGRFGLFSFSIAGLGQGRRGVLVGFRLVRFLDPIQGVFIEADAGKYIVSPEAARSGRCGADRGPGALAQHQRDEDEQYQQATTGDRQPGNTATRRAHGDLLRHGSRSLRGGGGRSGLALSLARFSESLLQRGNLLILDRDDLFHRVQPLRHRIELRQQLRGSRARPRRRRRVLCGGFLRSRSWCLRARLRGLGPIAIAIRRSGGGSILSSVSGTRRKH